jgi:hypothetical protein
MILVVLLVIFVGIALLAFTGFWVFPRVAARLHLSEAKLMGLSGLFMVLCLSAYAGWRIDCPFCHSGHVDSEGRCHTSGHFSIYWQDWDRMSEKDKSMFTGNPGHYRAATCPWCGHSGKMSRMAIWLD